MSYRDFAKALIKSGPSGTTFGPKQRVLDESNPSYQFPEDLWSPGQEPFIYFNIRESVGTTLKPMGNISMYMPPTIKVNYGAGWEEYSDDVAKLKSITGLDFRGSVEKLSDGNIMGALSQAYKDVQSTSEINKYLLYGVSNLVDAKLNSPAYAAEIRRALNKGRGMVVNPFTSMLYQGPKLRQFQLDFSLYARNQTESTNIASIIKAFKLAMHPNVSLSSNSSAFFNFPYYFDIFFITPATDKMFNIKRAALTDMNVDYAGAGTPSFFNESWAPVDIKMSLTFKEMELLTQNEIEDNY